MNRPQHPNGRYLLGLAACWISGCCCLSQQCPPCCTQTVKSLVKTVTSGGNTSEFFYDSQNRLALIKQSTGNSTAYTFGAGTVTQTDTVGGVAKTTVYTLNAQGLAASNDHGNTYTYDSNGYLIKSVSSAYTDTRTVVCGNVIVESRDGANALTFNEMYSALPDTVGSIFPAFLGKATRNMIQTQTYSDGTPPLSYVYDCIDGRVVTRYGGAGGTVTYSYY
jgi:hypothetical protein